MEAVQSGNIDCFRRNSDYTKNLFGVFRSQKRRNNFQYSQQRKKTMRKYLECLLRDFLVAFHEQPPERVAPDCDAGATNKKGP